jgi:hypothetical protein
MRRITLTVLIVGMFVISANSTYACWCRMPDVRESFDYADAVFAGEVIDIVEPQTADEKASVSELFYTIKFKVEKSWKGTSSQEITVFSRNSKKNCFSYPEVFLGEKYLIYANTAYENGAYMKGLLVISGCGNRTGILSEAGRTPFQGVLTDWQGRKYAIEDLKELDKITNPPYKLQLNLKSNAAPNNSFNRSGNSLFFIRQLEGSIQYFPPG